MALAPCPDCGAQVSSEAAACPSCGRSTGRRGDQALSVVAIVAIAVAGLLAFAIVLVWLESSV